MSGWSSPITHPRARKTYGCAACGLEITKGQRHERWMWRESYQKGAITVRAHLMCRALELGTDGEYLDGEGRYEFFDWLKADGITFDPDDTDWEDLFVRAIKMFDFLDGLARLVTA